ncbi:MAG: acyl carrier protein [Clostridia bacterium]|nr:acyl carrier protein [Clostridia bacterium]
MTFEQLLGILSDLHPEVDFEREQHLIDERILTSFDVVAIAAELMEGYGVELTAADILPENFNSARALFALIERLEQGA